MILLVNTIPHRDQAYPTIGNWHVTDGGIRVEVSDLGNSDYEFLVAMHELIEAYACRKFGITEQDVTDFDIAYEEARTESDSEPGNAPGAPYGNHHRFATTIEQLLAIHLGVNWDQYNNAVLNAGSDDASEENHSQEA